MFQSHRPIPKSKNIEDVALCISASEMMKSENLEKHKENIVPVNLESNKAEVHLESVTLKRKKITGPSLRSPYNRLQHEEIVTELKGPDKVNHQCNNNYKRIAPEPMAKRLHVSDECIHSNDESSNAHLEKLRLRLRDNGVSIMENYSNIDHTLEDKFVDACSAGGNLETPTALGSRKFTSDCESMHADPSASKNKDAPEPETSTILRRLLDGALNSEGNKNETLFAKDKNYALLGTCIVCSKEKRISYNSQENEICSSNNTVDIKLDVSSTCKKFASVREDAQSEIYSIITELLINCEQRMDRLIQKQQQESKEFHQVWEEKKFTVEMDHKLEADMIRYIYNEGPTRVAKLKTVDSNYGKIMEQNNLLKEAQLKDLEMKQLAARNVLREKQDNWLAKAKAICDSGQTSQSDEDSECGCVNLIVSEGRVCDEMRSVELNRGILSEVPKITDYVDPVELNNASDKGGAIITPDKLMNQRVEADGTNTVGLPLAGKVLEPSEEASPNHCSWPPVPEDQIYGRFVSDDPEETNAPILEGGGLQMTITSSKLVDAVAAVRPSVEAQIIKNCEQLPFGSIDVTPSSGLSPAMEVDSENHDSGRNLSRTVETTEALVLTREPSPQVEEVLEIQNNHVDVGLGPEAQMSESLECADLQHRDALVQKCQGTEQNVVSAPELVGTVPSHSETQTIETYEQLHLVSTDVSPSGNPSPATEVERQNCGSDSVRNSSKNAQTAEAVTFLHESSQLESDLEIQNNCTDMGSLSRVAHYSTAELSTSSPNNVAMSQVVSASETANPYILQLGVDADNVHGCSMLLHPDNPSNTPVSDPLENELGRLVKETNHLEQSCKDKVSRLKSECEKEIQEIIVQTRSKYKTRLEVVEADFILKKHHHQKNQNKVFANKVLADALRIHAAFPRIRQGATSGLLRQLPDQQLLQRLQHPPQSSACQAPSRLGRSRPTLHTGQHILLPGSTTNNCQNTVAPEQAMQHPMALFGNSTYRPPTDSARNLHLIGQSVSPAPHPRAFRPTRASSIAPATFRGISPSHLPQLQSSWPLNPPPLEVPQQPAPWPVSVPPYQNRAAPAHGLTALNNPQRSARDLIVEMNHQPPLVPWNHTSSLPDIGSTFGSLDSSYLESLDFAQAGNPSTYSFHHG